MTTIKFVVKSLNNKPIESATVNMDKNLVVEVPQGKQTFHVEATGYKGQDITIDVHDEVFIEKDVILLEINPQKTEEKAKENIVNVTTPIVQGVIDAFIFNTPMDIDSAKLAYKNLDKNIKAQKEVIEKALKDSVMDIFQAQATNLVYVAKSQLQPAMDYYVSERSKINPLGSWKDFRKWSEYTSMIAGIYLLRANLVKYLNKVLEKLQERF